MRCHQPCGCWTLAADLPDHLHAVVADGCSQVGAALSKKNKAAVGDKRTRKPIKNVDIKPQETQDNEANASEKDEINLKMDLPADLDEEGGAELMSCRE